MNSFLLIQSRPSPFHQCHPNIFTFHITKIIIIICKPISTFLSDSIRLIHSHLHPTRPIPMSCNFRFQSQQVIRESWNHVFILLTELTKSSEPKLLHQAAIAISSYQVHIFALHIKKNNYYFYYPPIAITSSHSFP